MNDEVCIERHKRVDETLKLHGDGLSDCEKRIDKLEQDGRELKTEIKNLCNNLKSLTDTLKAMIVLGGTTLTGFFIWYIQSK